MGRKPKIRVSYQHDASYLINLADAVSRDDSQTVEWRAEISALLNKIAAEMLVVSAHKLKAAG